MNAPPQPAAPRWCPQALRARLALHATRSIAPAALRPAAVALVCTEAGHGAFLPGLPEHAAWQGDPALLLTRRAETLRAHAGQWALPGGRIDEGETAEDAARRELFEELGLALPPQAVLGRLDDYATRSGYVITPVVLWGGPARTLTPNAAEVAAVHRVPVAELLRADAPLPDHTPGGERPVLRMPLGRRWGAAPPAAFLSQCGDWVMRGRATGVAHFDQPRFAWR